MTDALNTATIATLLEAGAVLATLAEPGKDLLNYATDFGEIACTLNFIAKGLSRAYDDRPGESNLDARNAVREARATALRTAKRALVDLAALIGELEGQP